MRKPGRTRQRVIMLKLPISLKLGRYVRYVWYVITYLALEQHRFPC